MTSFKTRPQKIAGPLTMWRDLFTPRELDTIEVMGDGLMPVRAVIAGRNDNHEHMRVTRVAWMARNPETAWLYERIEAAVLQLNTEFYHYDLFGLVESLQYSIYDGAEGGHYNWHVDHGEFNQEPRKISLSLQLTDQGQYEGCNLVMQAGDGPYVAERMRGTLIAFPSYVLHRVTPCTRGTRKAIVAWTAGPEFR